MLASVGWNIKKRKFSIVKMQGELCRVITGMVSHNFYLLESDMYVSQWILLIV